VKVIIKANVDIYRSQSCTRGHLYLVVTCIKMLHFSCLLIENSIERCPWEI